MNDALRGIKIIQNLIDRIDSLAITSEKADLKIVAIIKESVEVLNSRVTNLEELLYKAKKEEIH